MSLESRKAEVIYGRNASPYKEDDAYNNHNKEAATLVRTNPKNFNEHCAHWTDDRKKTKDDAIGRIQRSHSAE